MKDEGERQEAGRMKDEGGRMKVSWRRFIAWVPKPTVEVGPSKSFNIHPSSFILHPYFRPGKKEA